MTDPSAESVRRTAYAKSEQAIPVIVGMTERQAAEYCSANGLEFRVSEADGVNIRIDRALSYVRLTAVLVNGVVMAATVG